MSVRTRFRPRAISRFTAWMAVAFLTLAPPALSQTFIQQGPGYSIGPADEIQSRDQPPNGTVGAAIQAVLPHPTDASTMYVGGTNGGVWVTRNGGTNWTPLTDKQSSLSIASLAFDPTDASRRTLIAGTGLTSNGAVGVPDLRNRGGQRIGVLYSNDGGNSWSELGGAALSGKSIVGVAARGSTMLAAAAEPWEPSAPGGLYRSVTGGSSFDLVSGTHGLASGPVSSLAGDNANANTFYAAVSSTGIYKSGNGGADWTQVLALGANRIARVTTGGNGAVAVGVYDSSTGGDTSGQLVAIHHSRDGGASWTDLAVPPINPGRQASTDFAIAIDPANPNIVYVAGDRINEPPFTVTAYRVVLQADGTSVFETLTDEGTSNDSTTHADARALVIDALGRLIQGGDGGLYFRSNPQGIGQWGGLNSPAFSLREAYAVAYDSISRRLVMSAQDTGSSYQSAPNSPVFNAIGGGGDGLNAVVNDTTLRAAGRSVIYVTSQNLSPLFRYVVDANGNIVAVNSFELRANSTSMSGAEPDDFTARPRRVPEASFPFSSKFVLNSIDPQKIALGTNYVYTTSDPDGAAEHFTLTNIGTSGSPIGPVSALAYGTKDNHDAVLAGSDNGLYLSATATTGSLQRLPAYGGIAPSSVVFDARAYTRFFAADTDNLWGTVNAGGTFTNLTGNLTALNIIRPTGLEFISNLGVEALVVGGVSAVANAQSPLAVADSDGDGGLSNWRSFGFALPNTIANQMSYNKYADVLAVSLFGRGAWLLYDVTTWFPSAYVLRFGSADNDSSPPASILTNGNYASRDLEKVGLGTLTIEGTASYTGRTLLQEGRMTVNGDISRSSDLFVQQGATLGGIGIVPTTAVSGVMAPGNSIGTLTVKGNLTFNPGSTYQVELSGSSGDLIAVTGSAQLDGTTQATFLSGGGFARSYTILTAADGIDGTFDGVSATGLPSFLAPSLGYGATNVTLNLQSVMASTPGLRSNQASVGRAIDWAFNAGPGLGAMPALFSLSQGQIPPALSMLSGDNASVGQSLAINTGGQFANVLAGRALNRRAAGPTALAQCAGKAERCDGDSDGGASETSWSAWANGFGGAQWLNADTSTGSAPSQQNIGGGAFGGDWRPGPGSILGLAVAMSGSGYSVPTNGASGRATGFHFGAYGLRDWGPLYVNAALAYSHFDGNATRFITGVGTTETARSYTTSNQFAGRLEVGRAFELGLPEQSFTLTPFTALQPVQLWTAGYSESSVTSNGTPGVFALSYQPQSTASLPLFLGAQLEGKAEIDAKPFKAWLRVAWVHEFLPDRNVTAGFEVLPGSTFTVDGARAASNAARFDLGATYAMGSQMSLFANGSAEVSGRGQSLAGTVGLRVAW